MSTYENNENNLFLTKVPMGFGVMPITNRHQNHFVQSPHQ